MAARTRVRLNPDQQPPDRFVIPTHRGPEPLAVHRMNRGFTQKGLADAAGVHINSISLTERRVHVGPNDRNMAKICAVLGVQPDDVCEFIVAKEERRKRLREGFWQRMERMRREREGEAHESSAD